MTRRRSGSWRTREDRPHRSIDVPTLRIREGWGSVNTNAPLGRIPAELPVIRSQHFSALSGRSPSATGDPIIDTDQLHILGLYNAVLHLSSIRQGERRNESSENASSGNAVACITTSASSRGAALLSRFIDICLPAHRGSGAGSALSLSCGNATVRVTCRALRSTQIFSPCSL